jgi:hypothetical protein
MTFIVNQWGRVHQKHRGATIGELFPQIPEPCRFF